MAKLFAFTAVAIFSSVHGQDHADIDKADIYSGPYRYNPYVREDPFDTMAQTVSQWMTSEALPFQCTNPEWRDDLCSCLQNGNIQSWFQANSFFYVMAACNKDEGFILRTSHMQDRHIMPLQALMACDTLKLMSYCVWTTCPAAVGNWTPACEGAHYSSPGCDVDCNAAPEQARSSILAIVLALVAGSVAALNVN